MLLVRMILAIASGSGVLGDIINAVSFVIYLGGFGTILTGITGRDVTGSPIRA